MFTGSVCQEFRGIVGMALYLCFITAGALYAKTQTNGGGEPLKD